MKEYQCEDCGKMFDRKSNWIQHTKNKKYPCIKKENNLSTIEKKNIPNEQEIETNKVIGSITELKDTIIINKKNNNLKNLGAIKKKLESFKINNISNKSIEIHKKLVDDNLIKNLDLQKTELSEPHKNFCLTKNFIRGQIKFTCKYCFKDFLYNRNLNKHIREERCAVLRLQKQQKENIFINLLTEEKIVNETKKELTKISKSKENISNNIDYKETKPYQMSFLIKQIEILNKKLDEQKKESEKKQEKFKIETEKKIKLMTDRYVELEKNNSELKKTNEKLQNKVIKIVTKNKITNTTTNNNNNIINTFINNPIIKLVNFGSEDLNKISYNIFIDTIKSQGAGLYNKAIDGIHFNKDYPENQNIYISDINRGKVMIYKDEKWFLDNWDNIYPVLLEQIIQFGYDKNDFLKDCGYKVGDIRYNKQMIKNGLRWYKLLDGDEDDIEYFELEPSDRPQIDDETYQSYLDMYNFRKKHPKKLTEKNIKEKIKLNMYNKREVPITNYKQIEDLSKKILLIE